MAATVKLEGFAELDRALREFPKVIGKGVLRRTANLALKPMLLKAKALAPSATGQLSASIMIKTTRDAKFAKQARSSFLSTGSSGGVKRDASNGISLSLAPSARRGTNLHKYAYYQEFGRVDMPAQPYMRPAWSATKEQALEIVKTELGHQILKAANRLAKKRAKAGL